MQSPSMGNSLGGVSPHRRDPGPRSSDPQVQAEEMFYSVASPDSDDEPVGQPLEPTTAPGDSLTMALLA